MEFPHPIAASIDDLVSQVAGHRAFLLGWDRDGSGQHGDGFLSYRSGIPHPTLNGVAQVRGVEAREAVARAHHRLGGTPGLWWLGPDVPAAFVESLLAEGVSEVARLPMMAVGLTRREPIATPEGVVITRAESAHDVTGFADVYAAVSHIAVPEPGALVDRLLAFDGNSEGTIVRFTARAGHQVVGTSAAWLSNGVAGVYHVTTSPAWRRRGIGAALTAAALDTGREAGLKVGTLIASAMAESMYRSMGFAVVAHYRVLSSALT